jgi:hypothetical protein
MVCMRALRRAPCIHAPLHRLGRYAYTKPGEKSGLKYLPKPIQVFEFLLNCCKILKNLALENSDP